MNESESSDESEVLSDIDYMESFTETTNMDTVCYSSLVNSVREALSTDISIEIKKSTFTGFFCELLNDCWVCLDQSLKTVTNMLKDEINTNILVEYLNNAVSLLQLLSDFNKTVMEVTIDCNRTELYKNFPENFPTKTGWIIMTVFSHCRDSDKLYRDNLKTFEAQLKDLFKNCHQLQVTYLLILEKHDLMYNNSIFEQRILIEALKINLKIGEIVQSLDVKTMAEHWKSYTALCEKYSYNLINTNLYQHSTKILCRMVRKNISCAVEENQEEKVVIRSLKVASFTMKILLKICGILKELRIKDFTYILDLVYDVFVHRDSQLYTVCNKSKQFIQLWDAHIIVPIDNLIKELIVEVRFHNIILHSDSTDPKKMAVYILIHTSVMKSLLNSDEFVSKVLIIGCALDSLICAQARFLKIQGLYEHMLVHTAALATTLNNNDFNNIEKRMFEALLGKDSSEAMFFADLWILLSRYTSSQLIFNQLIWLCSLYKKLDSIRMFTRSPQKVHLSYILRNLFEVLDDENKMKICKQFRVNDDDNLSLWVAICVNKLPNEMKNVEDGIFEKLRAQFAEINKDQSRTAVDKLINLLKLSATCRFTNRGILNTIVNAWLRICPNQQPLRDIDSTAIWFYDYVVALTSVTEAILDKVNVDGASVVKILHIVTNHIEKGDTELKLILTKLLCKLISYNVDEYRNKVNSDCYNALSNMLFNSEIIVRNNLIVNMNEYKNNHHFQDKFSEDIEIWSKIKSGRYNEVIDNSNYISSREYYHKCPKNMKIFRTLSNNSNSLQEIQKSDSIQEINVINNGFDVEMVNENEEPMRKKVKLDEIEIIVCRLENDVIQLSNVKENVLTDYKIRFKNICDKLSDLIN